VSSKRAANVPEIDALFEGSGDLPRYVTRAAAAAHSHDE